MAKTLCDVSLYLCINCKLLEEVLVLRTVWVTAKKQNGSVIKNFMHKFNLCTLKTIAKVCKVFLAGRLENKGKRKLSWPMIRETNKD